MKVYVDELPEKCEDCVFSETGFVYDDEVRFCKLKPRCMNWIALYDKKRKDCTLFSLAEHDKQVRNQVCKRLREWARKQIIICGGKATETDILTANASNEVLDDLKEFLDQIQGENND